MSTTSTQNDPVTIHKTCEKCGAPEQRMYAHAKQNHASWAPVSSDKRIFLECPQCKRILELDKEPLSQDEVFEEEAQEEMAPSPGLKYLSYLGIAFLSLLLLWGIMNLLQEDRSVQNFLLKPEPNVLFISKNPSQNFHVGKIDSIQDGIIRYSLDQQDYKSLTDAEEKVLNLQNHDSLPTSPQPYLSEKREINLNEINQLNLRRVYPLH